MAPIPNRSKRLRRTPKPNQGLGRQFMAAMPVSKRRKLENTLNAIVSPEAAILNNVARRLSFSEPKKKKKSRSQDFVSGGKFSKKTKKNDFAVYTKKGIVTTQEVGSLSTGVVPSLPNYVGHATHANVYLIQRTFWRAVVRDIFTIAGINIADIETDSPGVYNLNVDYTTNLANADTQISIATTGKSYNQIASDLYTQWNLVTPTVAGQSYLYITEVSLGDGSRTVAKRDYKICKVHCYVKSDLKIQNRTVAGGADEDANSTENVANQPLYGKSYYGKGNGLICKIDSTAANAAKALVVGDQTGLLNYVLPAASGTGSSFWLNEPPLPTLFTPKPKYTRANIEPGHIKTSTLAKKVVMKQTDMWQILQLVPSVSNNSGRAQQSRYGEYRIFAFEKMICATAGDTPPILGLEVNQRCGLYLQFVGNKDSAEICELQTFV